MTTITAMYSLIHKFCGNTIEKTTSFGDGFYIDFEEVILRELDCSINEICHIKIEFLKLFSSFSN